MSYLWHTIVQVRSALLWFSEVYRLYPSHSIPRASPLEFHYTQLRLQYPYTLKNHSTTIKCMHLIKSMHLTASRVYQPHSLEIGASIGEPHIWSFGRNAFYHVSMCPCVWFEHNGHVHRTRGCYNCLRHVHIAHAHNAARMSSNSLKGIQECTCSSSLGLQWEASCQHVPVR